MFYTVLDAAGSVIVDELLVEFEDLKILKRKLLVTILSSSIIWW